MQTIDQRVVVLEQAANTISAVTINALLAIITSISKLESLDKQALKAELESLKAVHVQNGNQAQYSDIISLLQQRIS
jgi:plasmid replication initiation protein